jgi:hypothetical protein
MGDLVTRDFLNGFTEARQRSSRLAAWFRLPEPYYFNQISQYNQEMFNLKANSVNLLENFYKTNAIKQKEAASKAVISEKKFNVISDYEYINQYLKHERFAIVN